MLDRKIISKTSLKANDEVFMYVINHLMQQQLEQGSGSE
jgi:hypothetical protein